MRSWSTTDQDVLLQRPERLLSSCVIWTARGLKNRPGWSSIAMPDTAKTHGPKHLAGDEKGGDDSLFKRHL